VAAHIRRLVFDGVLRPGERVRQDDIAAELGVSRIPVREAIIALEREGWVTIEPHRGAFVVGFDRASVHDHYELYGLLFGLAAERVVERAAATEIDAVCSAFETVAAASDPASFRDANARLVNAMLDAAHSPRLVWLQRVMTTLVPGNFFAEVPGSMDVQRAGLAEVVSHLRAGDGSAAARAWHDLLRSQGEAVCALFAERGLFAAVPSKM
jgi:DNA-binding GntR family transcriptional regulator